MSAAADRRVIIFAVGCLVLAARADYRQRVEAGWLQGLNPAGEPAAEISAVHLDDARRLLHKTVELVERAGGTLSADQRAALQQIDRQTVPEENRAFFMKVRWLRREILFSHPSLDFEQILINRNPPTLYSHNGDQHLARHSRSGPGLTLLRGWKTEPEADAFLEGILPEGATRNPDLNYDADRVVFAFADYERTAEPLREKKGHAKTHGPAAPENGLERRYFLYEAAVDGSWVRQITGTADDPFITQDNRATVIVEDNDPCYLPDGDLVFISTRSQTFGRCHGGRYNPAWVLYRCAPDGTGMRQLSFGNENEYEPSVINDGRLVFSRWEYTSRHEMLFHMLWWCRPDGTGVANYYGNDTLHPMMVVEQTAIPGTQKVAAVAQGHHQYNSGTVIVIDTAKGENGEEPLTHITPETPYAETKGWPKPHYSHPYPLSENLFLVSRANHRLTRQGQRVPANDRAIYLIDDLGGREFIYEDPACASFSPIPVKPRPRPPVIAGQVAADDAAPGTLFLQNVYLTRNDPEGRIEPGSIKSLRVNALGVQPHAQRQVCTPYVNVEIPKKVLGTVPVNPDGSAFFSVPAKVPVQLQALDADGRAVLTEKTFFYLQPGENRSCVGCHEPVGTSPDMGAMARVMRNGLSPLKPAAGPEYPGGMAFAGTVQPVLDRYCIGCHGLDKKEGGISLLYEPFQPPEGGTADKALKRLRGYPVSYVELTRRGNFELGYKPRMNKPYGNISEAFEAFYARGCSVSEMILANHGDVHMDAESRMRIFEWMDLNAPMYGGIFPKRNRPEDRRFDREAMAALRREAARLLGAEWADQPDCALVNRAFPQESRILMAPLAAEAGGWGQVEVWQSKDDPGFKTLEALVMKSFIRPKNENDGGWLPTAEQGGVEAWVQQDRDAYRAMLLR